MIKKGRKAAAKLAAAARSRPGRRVVKVLRVAFVAAVLAWLGWQLSDIGWGEVWAARPQTPWFYVIWAALYFQLPAVESLIYRALWGLPVREGLGPIIRKRALNQDVVSYAGEAYFFVWARRRLDLPDGRIAGTLKDNAVASGLGTWTAALLLIGGCLLTGQLVLVELVGRPDPLYAVGGAVLLGGLAVLALRFRRALLTLPSRTVLGLFGVHLGRFAVVYVLQVLQWWVVLPEAPLSVWATMLAVTTLINRLPLVPAKDLVAIGAVLGMTDLLAASSATIAAMLLMRSALDKMTNLLLFGGTLAFDRRSRAATAGATRQPATPPPLREPEPLAAEG